MPCVHVTLILHFIGRYLIWSSGQYGYLGFSWLFSRSLPLRNYLLSRIIAELPMSIRMLSWTPEVSALPYSQLRNLLQALRGPNRLLLFGHGWLYLHMLQLFCSANTHQLPLSQVLSIPGFRLIPISISRKKTTLNVLENCIHELFLVENLQILLYSSWVVGSFMWYMPEYPKQRSRIRVLWMEKNLLGG